MPRIRLRVFYYVHAQRKRLEFLKMRLQAEIGRTEENSAAVSAALHDISKTLFPEGAGKKDAYVVSAEKALIRETRQALVVRPASVHSRRRLQTQDNPLARAWREQESAKQKR